MPQNERLRVWKGDLKKTSGGLTKAMLMKNKRGKIVSKAKSEAAKKNKENNLGQWLRSKGEQFLSKGLKQENIVRKNKAGRKAFKKKEDDIPEEKQSEVKKKHPKSRKSMTLSKKPWILTARITESLYPELETECSHGEPALHSLGEARVTPLKVCWPNRTNLFSRRKNRAL